jgi:Pyruvate/2-oxoacid:ferredoxin oxidoreductase gamma subunit
LIEVRIHGRGGQGNVVAAYLLATAAIDEGHFGQAFPAFGAERRGAPVVAFVRIADRTLRRRNQVLQPDFLIIQDRALLKVPGVLDGLRPGGGILVNTSLDAATLGEQARSRGGDPARHPAGEDPSRQTGAQHRPAGGLSGAHRDAADDRAHRRARAEIQGRTSSSATCA